jgi:hypothetical protein
MSQEPKLTQASNGEWLFNKGKHLVAGQPKYKQFRLGTDRTMADAKATALLMVWKRETAKDENWLWTEESINRALAFADGATNSTPRPESVRPVVTQAFPSQVYVPPAPITSLHLSCLKTRHTCGTHPQRQLRHTALRGRGVP